MKAIVMMTTETADDFVLPVEVDNMIHGKRSNYTPLLNEVEYTSTNALQFAYATRVGDINMENVTLCDDTKDGNLKPISTYDLKKGVAQMEELAAVTPICDAATRYLAADILSDVAAGYRTDYDRKLAQLVIVRMQQAINTTGNAVEFNPTDSIDALVKFIKATTKVSDTVVNGKFVFNAKTKAQLAEYIFRAAANGELGKETMTTGETPTIFGYPYVVVPNDLMPTLGEADTRSFKAANIETNVIETVTINSPVFYGDLSEFRGKTSGSLKYDVSAEASYEVNNEVRSAWQRNELIIRGSFNRGGYIADTSVIAGLTSKSN
jgi:HK97 family phage major capsid protein